jgi:hypothetical protein
MNEILKLSTDTACLMIFDPTLLVGIDPPVSYFSEHPALKDGRFAMLDVGGDKSYRVRLTRSTLKNREQELVVNTLGPAGVSVRSGKVYVTGHDLPGETMEFYQQSKNGRFVDMENGDYLVYVFELEVRYDESNKLPDYVVQFHERTGDFSL